MDLATSIILGHMPFVGISYQSRKKDEEYRERFSEMSTTQNIIEEAIRFGVHRFAAATLHSSPLSPNHLHVLRLIINEGHNIELFPCVEIPLKLGHDEVDAYRRWATYAHIESRLCREVKQRMINDPILNFRDGWKDKLTAGRPYKEENFRKLVIDWERIDNDLQFFAELPVCHIEFGSETDFLAMAGRFDLLGELVDKAKDSGFQNVLFGVHHAGVTVPILNDNLEGYRGIVTPLNSLGIMMFPTKLLAERAIRSVKKAIYAIKPLGGGRISPEKAFAYVFSFDVESCMVGVCSISELKENLKVAMEVLGGTS